MQDSATATGFAIPMHQILDNLTDRLRNLLDGDPRITEKRMFGGVTFLLNGHMLISANKTGRAMAHVGKPGEAEALARPGATPMVHGGRRMSGFIWVDPDAIEDDDDLQNWIALSERYVAGLPPK